MSNEELAADPETLHHAYYIMVTEAFEKRGDPRLWENPPEWQPGELANLTILYENWMKGEFDTIPGVPRPPSTER